LNHHWKLAGAGKQSAGAIAIKLGQMNKMIYNVM
jgi:hypothetical protein